MERQASSELANVRMKAKEEKIENSLPGRGELPEEKMNLLCGKAQFTLA